MLVPIRPFLKVNNTTCREPRKSPLLLALTCKCKNNRPLVQYRQAGDRYIMVEYGDPMTSLDFTLRARIKVLQDGLRLFTDPETKEVKDPLILGTLDAAPCM